jgi:hypothetical protein
MSAFSAPASSSLRRIATGYQHKLLRPLNTFEINIATALLSSRLYAGSTQGGDSEVGCQQGHSTFTNGYSL